VNEGFMTSREKLRETLKFFLNNIIEDYKVLHELASDLPHPSGQAHVSLKPRSGMYLIDNKKGILAEYHQGENKYEISIKILSD
jgi:hypothetical protein